MSEVLSLVVSNLCVRNKFAINSGGWDGRVGLVINSGGWNDRVGFVINSRGWDERVWFVINSVGEMIGWGL